MIDDALVILDYLPVEYRTAQEQEYVDFLWESFQSNYEHGKYQFAFIAYHMLFMCFVYFSVWKIKLFRGQDFSKALIGFGKEIETNFINGSSPFALSEIKERSILRFFKLLGCDNDRISEFSSIVDDRNDIAHSNGNVFYKTQQELDDKIQEVLSAVDKINACFSQITLDVFVGFLMGSYNPANREYVADNEQFSEILLRNNYFSRKDIEQCLQFNISRLSSHPDFPAIEIVFNSFKSAYQPLITA